MSDAAGQAPTELHIVIDGQSDLAGQVYRQTRDAILSGLLRTGDALPPTHELGRRLGVARN